jgi:hypothetical protein
LKIHVFDTKTRIVEALNRPLGPVVIELSKEDANHLGLILDSFIDAMSQGGTTAYAEEVALAQEMMEAFMRLNNVIKMKK